MIVLGSVMVLSVSSTAFANVRLAFDSTSLDFGDVAVFASKDLTLLVQDTATVPIEIDAIISTGLNASEFTVLSPQSMPVVVNPGQLATQVIVKFNPQALGTRTASLLIETTDGNVTIPLTGIGSGKQSSLSWSVSALNFGTLAPDAERDSTIELYSSGTDSSLVSSLEIAAADTSFSAEIINHSPMPFMLAPGDSVGVRIAFRGLPLTGLKNAQLSAIGSTLNTPSCDLLGDVEYGSFEVNPLSLDFGTMYDGQIKDTTILIIDTSSEDLVFEDLSLSPSGDDFTILNPPTLPFTLHAGDTLSLTIRANPGKFTSHRSSLQAVSFSANSHLTQALLTLNAIPVPINSPSHQSLVYYCAESTVASDSISISDTGTKDFIITAIRFSDTSLALHIDVPPPDTIRSVSDQAIHFSFDPSLALSDTLILQFLGGTKVMFDDTITLDRSFAHAAPIVRSVASTNTSQGITVGANTSLTMLQVDTTIVELTIADTNLAIIQSGSISHMLSNVTISSIESVPGGYRITLTSPQPIVVDSGMSFLNCSLDRFITNTDSTFLIATIATPERDGCIQWKSDTLALSGTQVCGSNLLQSALANRPLILSAVLEQNPVFGIDLPLTVIASSANNSIYEITNEVGNIVAKGSLSLRSAENNFSLSLPSVPAGAYILRLVPANGFPVSLRFLKLE